MSEPFLNFGVILNATDSLTVNGTSSFADDVTINGITVGNVYSSSGWYGIRNANITSAGDTDFALVQSESGYTVINSSSGQDLALQIGNSTKLLVTTNSNVVIDTVKLGTITSSAAFAHKDLFNTTDYALRQNSSGDTVLNAASGRTLHLRNGESTVATITNTHLNVNRIKPMNTHLRIEENDSTPTHQLWMGYGGNKWRKIILEVANSGGSNDAQIYFVRNGSWVSWSTIASDSRIKQNQQLYPPSDSMNIVRTIKVKKYFNTQLQSEVKGFIAQEVEEILPEAVETHDLSEAGKESDFKMLDYRRLQVHAFGAIQFLDSIIETQQTQINNLISQNDLLKSKLNELLTESGRETIP